MARLSDIRLRRSAVSGSIPSTSNLNLGELALNTADGKVYMKKSVGGTDTIVEVGSGSGISSSFIAYEYTATANQTTFSGTDNNSNTLAYNTGTPPSVQVFMNGILLDEGSSQDYTGTNGTSVVLTTAADAGDLIQIHAYKSDVSIVSNLTFNDNQKLLFGDSQDLQIYHNGSNSYIDDVGTGDLIIKGGNDILFQDAVGNTLANMNQSNSIELYFGGSKKFETTSTGVDVSGNLDASGSVFFNSDLRANNVSNKLIVKATSSTTELHAAGSTGIIFKDSGNGQTASLDNGGNLVLNGLLSAEDNIYLTDAGTARAKLLLNSSDRDNVELRAESIGSTMKFFTAATEALELDASQKASFKGSIVLNSNGKVVEIADAAIQWYSYPDSAYKQAKFRATDYQFKNGGNTPVMTVSSGGNLTTSGVITANGTSGSSFYGITLSRSSSGTTTPDIWGSSGTLVIGTSSSDEVLGMSGTAATFYGTLASGAITSTGSSSFGNITTTGYIRGPSTFTIDPATHGDDTGTLVIAGNLQVDGTTTTINSTTLTVDDKNITLASGSVNAAAANGAGLTVAGASANFVYESTNDRWTLNKEVFTAYGFMVGTTSTDVGLIKNSSGVFDFQAQSGRQISFSNVTNGEHVRIDATGNVGIGNNSPSAKLEVQGTSTSSTYTGTSPTGTVIRAQANSGTPWISSELNGATAYFAPVNSTTAKFAAYNYATSTEMNIQLGQTRMYIKNDGNVGIGTDNPSEKLTVDAQSADGVTTTIASFHSNEGESGDTAIQLAVRRSDALGSDRRTFLNATGAGNFEIQRNGSTKATISASGNVGINETNPTTTLTVGGIVQIKESSNTAFYGANYVRMFGDQNYYFRNTGGATRAHISMADGDLNLYNSSTVLTNRISTNSDSYFNGGNVGIGTTSPNFPLHINKGTSSYAPTSGVNENVFGINTSGYADGRQGVSFSRLDGNWIDGTSGTDTAYGWVWSYENNVRGGLVYDHRGSERMQLFSSYGALGFITPNAADGNGVPTDSNMVERLTILPGGNVGIATASPSDKLDIAGALRLTANISFDSNKSGRIYKASNHGLAFHGVTGSANDFAMFTPAGQLMVTNPTGTNHLSLIPAASGSVGIGTDAPDAKLHVKNGDVLIQGGTTTTTVSELGFTNAFDTAFIRSKYTDPNATTETYMAFHTNASGATNGTVAEQMRIAGNKVGIGTTNPDTNLEVDIKNGADGNGIHITSTSTTNDPTLKLTRNGSADRFQLMVRGAAGGARLGISAGANLDSGLNLGSNNGLSIGTVTAAGSGGLLVDNDIKSNSRFGVGSGGSLADAAIYKNSDTNTGIYWPGTDQIALTTAGSNRLHIASNGGVSLNSQSQLTTGGNARLSIIDSSVQLSMGASNNDMAYIRKQGAGQFAWQTYNSGNSGMLQLQPYGGNVTINTTAAVSGHALSVSGKIGGLTYSDSYVQFTGGNAILKANDDVIIGYTNALYVKQSGKVGVGTSDPKAEFQVDHAGIDAYSVNTSATSAAQVDTFSATDFRSARFTVQITNTTDSTYQITEILLIHDGTTPSMTEYSTIFTGSAREASFDADIVSGNVRLLATPASTDTMQFKVVRHSILV